MIVAICFSGFIRSIRKSIDSYVRFLKGASEIHIFVHTWDVENYAKEIEDIKKHPFVKRVFCEQPYPFEINPYETINVQISPEEYRKEIALKGQNKIFFETPSFENNFKFHKNKEVVRYYHHSSFPYNFLSQFYSVHQANNLQDSYSQDSGIKYDLVIRSRTDLILQDVLDLSSISKTHVSILLDGIATNDHFAIGTPEIMKKYSSMFLFIPAYYFTFKEDLIQELILKKHLEAHNIEVQRIRVETVIDRETFEKEATNREIFIR